MEAEYNLPLGELPQNALVELPDITDGDWAPLRKALETYTRISLNYMRHWIHNTDEGELEECWDGSKYNLGNPPDKTKISLKSPLQPGLPGDQIQDVVASFQKYLGVDPPEDYLHLLRITNGVRAAGTYDMETMSRIQLEPFSLWEEVKYKLEALPLSERGIERSVPPETKRRFALSPLSSEDLELVCGFKCDLLINSYDDCGVWYFLVNPRQTDALSKTKTTGKHWRIVGCPISRSGYETFASVESVLKEWAELYLHWAESM